MARKQKLTKGDYVLATKWHDGTPGDPWCVGFYDRSETTGRQCRHFVVDSDGQQFHPGGFRRVKKISQQRGEFILQNRDLIDSSPYGRSLWWWVRAPYVLFFRIENGKSPEQEGTSHERNPCDRISR